MSKGPTPKADQLRALREASAQAAERATAAADKRDAKKAAKRKVRR